MPVESPKGAGNVRAEMVKDGNSIQLVLQADSPLACSAVERSAETKPVSENTIKTRDGDRDGVPPARSVESPKTKTDGQASGRVAESAHIDSARPSSSRSRLSQSPSRTRFQNLRLGGEGLTSEIEMQVKGHAATGGAKGAGGILVGDRSKSPELEEEDPDAYDDANIDQFLRAATHDELCLIGPTSAGDDILSSDVATSSSNLQKTLTYHRNGLPQKDEGALRSNKSLQRISVPSILPAESNGRQGLSTAHCGNTGQDLLEAKRQLATSKPRGEGFKDSEKAQFDSASARRPVDQIFADPGSLRGKKLHVPPGTSIRRRLPSDKEDPLGDALNLHSNLVAHTVCHPLLAKKRAAEKAASREAALLAAKADAAAAIAAQAKKRKSGGLRPATAQGRGGMEDRFPGPATHRGGMRPASAMARMTQYSGPQMSENMRRTFEAHERRMAAMSQTLVNPSVDMRDACVILDLEAETPSKQRRASASKNRILRGVLDYSSSVQEPTTNFEDNKAILVKMGSQSQPREKACTAMPPKMSAASTAELSRTMDARLDAIIGWAERETDSAATDAKLTDWFGKWLQSYELEQNVFKSAQVYGEVKMTEILNSASLDRLTTPNRFRTAVVCDMFGRIMPIFGRYKGLMQQIRHEMMQAIYPDLRSDTHKSAFEMIPFFTHNETVSQEISDLKGERDRLLSDLSEQEERMIDVQRKVREYREEIQSVKIEAAWSRSKQNQMEVSLLSQHFGGDNREELISQNKKLSSELNTESLLKQAAQDRIRELQSDLDMLKIRVQTAEKEWKDACKTIDDLNKELSIVKARSDQGGGTAKQVNIEDVKKMTIVDWANNVLGAPKGKPFLQNMDKDLGDCSIYLELVNIIWGSDDDVRKRLEFVKNKRSHNDKSDGLAELLGRVLQCTLVRGDQLQAGKSFIHSCLLLELMCSHLDAKVAKELDGIEDTGRSHEASICAAVRRATLANLIQETFALDVKCEQQTAMLTEVMGEVVDDEQLEHHASTKLTPDSIQLILTTSDPQCPATQCSQLAQSCFEKLQKEGRSLHGAFHYYCKLAEKGTNVEDLTGSKQATYLSGMETMDEDEFKALVCGAKLQLPKLMEASQSAFQSTIAQQQKDAGEGEHPDLGMGFVHFEECLIQLAINLSPQWANGSPNILLFVPEVLETLCRHIADNCERLQHVEFGLLVRAENMQPVWSEHAPELKEGFKLYCSEEDNSAMSLHDFLRFLKETKIAGARLGVPAMVDIFSCVQEEASDSSSTDTMDYDEFLEAIAACAVYMDPSPYLSLPTKVLEFMKATVLPGMEAAKSKKKGRQPSKKELVKKKK